MKRYTPYKATINLPKNFRIEKKKNFLIFCGPLGYTKLNLKKIDKKGYFSYKINPDKKYISFESSILSVFKSLKTLIKDKINGVSRGFLLYLRIVGIGYRAILNKKSLIFKLGYSHDIVYTIPDSIRVFLIEPTLLCFFGLDKNQVTQIAIRIKGYRPPSPYKGKGIKLLNEKVILKQGKQN